VCRSASGRRWKRHTWMPGPGTGPAPDRYARGVRNGGGENRHTPDRYARGCGTVSGRSRFGGGRFSRPRRGRIVPARRRRGKDEKRASLGTVTARGVRDRGESVVNRCEFTPLAEAGVCVRARVRNGHRSHPLPRESVRSRGETVRLDNIPARYRGTTTVACGFR
jgi:hypothetical protein